ncbi:TetR/AcrR family transcriptional regulator C-terminal domain-containing protein [Saccharopolyspora sp. NPDC047091]|uniref:TetR/AcrR family transcriptional regulator n=1 Tax=Saccharopolyspora sp. NPDC047091 TaxID=3155924 RepID=UPI0033CAD0F4
MARPKVPLLSAEIIADGALALVDTTGDIQMVQLAKSLGVAPSSLYGHVGGRGDVIDLARRRMLEQMGTPDAHDWREAVSTLLRGLAGLYIKHRRILPLIFDTKFADERSIAAYEPVFAALIRGGFPFDQLLPIIGMIEFQAFGLAQRLPAPTMSDAIRDALPAYAVSVDNWRDDCDVATELAVSVLVGGLEKLRTKSDRGS